VTEERRRKKLARARERRATDPIFRERDRAAQKRRRDRRTDEQRAAQAAYLKRWRAENPEACKRNRQRWYEENKEKAEAGRRSRQKKVYEKRKRYLSAWYQKNKERRVEQATQWRLANKERWNRYADKWRKENPDELRAYAQKRMVIVRTQTVGTVTADDIKAILAENGSRCVYCNKRKATTIDHVIPLSRGGAHAVHNLAGACLPCNASKGSKLLGGVD
jgi:5-methylcytosine-specific restriction endonuclease McrA